MHGAKNIKTSDFYNSKERAEKNWHN